MESLNRVEVFPKRSRQTKVSMRGIAISVLAFKLSIVAFAAPTHLRTNALTAPIGVGTPNPTFSWLSDIAFEIPLSDTYPSWGYMVKKGATTWWERWNGVTGDPSMNSYNHYAFGSVMAWVYRRAAGIDTDSAGSGYKHIVIQPHFDPGLPQLHVEYDSAYGTIVSDWQQTTRTFTVKTSLNTSTSIQLPDGRRFEVGSGSHRYRILMPAKTRQ